MELMGGVGVWEEKRQRAAAVQNLPGTTTLLNRAKRRGLR